MREKTFSGTYLIAAAENVYLFCTECELLQAGAAGGHTL